MSDLSPIYAALQKADAAGDAVGAKQLADYIRSQGAAKQQEGVFNPAAEGNTLQVYNPFGQNLNTGIALSPGVNNFLAGAGKATTDLARGMGQFGAGIADVISPRQQTLGGLVTGSSLSRVAQMRQGVADTRRLDAPLMGTGPGKAGFM